MLKVWCKIVAVSWTTDNWSNQGYVRVDINTKLSPYFAWEESISHESCVLQPLDNRWESQLLGRVFPSWFIVMVTEFVEGFIHCKKNTKQDQSFHGHHVSSVFPRQVSVSEICVEVSKMILLCATVIGPCLTLLNPTPLINSFWILRRCRQLLFRYMYECVHVCGKQRVELFNIDVPNHCAMLRAVYDEPSSTYDIV